MTLILTQLTLNCIPISCNFLQHLETESLFEVLEAIIGLAIDIALRGKNRKRGLVGNVLERELEEDVRKGREEKEEEEEEEEGNKEGAEKEEKQPED
jgi:hypothetical protein